MLVEHGPGPIRPPLRSNPNTVTTEFEQAHGAIRTPARTIPDILTTVPSKLYGFDRAAVRFHPERCTLWIVTPYAFTSGRRTDCSVIRTLEFNAGNTPVSSHRRLVALSCVA